MNTVGRSEERQTPRTTLQAMNLCIKISFGESHTQCLVSQNAEGERNALRVLPVYLVFEDEKTVTQKIIENHWTNKGSTNFHAWHSEWKSLKLLNDLSS